MNPAKLEIAKQFNATIFSIIDILKATIKDTTEKTRLDKLKSKISFALSASGQDFILEIASEYFIKHSDDIINRNEQIFMEYQQPYGDGEFSGLLDCIKQCYTGMKQAEKDVIYKKVKTLLEKWVEFS